MTKQLPWNWILFLWSFCIHIVLFLLSIYLFISNIRWMHIYSDWNVECSTAFLNSCREFFGCWKHFHFTLWRCNHFNVCLLCSHRFVFNSTGASIWIYVHVDSFGIIVNINNRASIQIKEWRDPFLQKLHIFVVLRSHILRSLFVSAIKFIRLTNQN